jgi:D-amino-acid dehydrogenase
MTGIMPTTADPAAGNDAIVVGAGIVGVCSALWLQRTGFRVTLIDRDPPGEGCSSGNAGNLGIASCVPNGVPGILSRVPRLLFDPAQPLSIRLGHFPKALPWFVRFARASGRERAERITAARASLLARVFDAYAPLVAESGADDLIERTGWLAVYEKRASLTGAAFEFEMRRRFGVEMTMLSGDEAREMEPALGPIASCAVYYPRNGRTVNPLRLTRVFARHFVRSGGVLLREAARAINIGGDGKTRVVTDAGEHTADRLVLAAGVWSKSLARGLGSRIPLEAERGYHTMMPEPGVTVRRQLTFADRGVAIAPMEHGLRVSGIAEFAHPGAAPDYRHADRVLGHARDLIPGLNADGATRWMGCRPATPDSLPVIGRSPHHPAVLFAFGHGHLGLTFAAITGMLIAELAAGRPTSVDISPFRADRF